MTDPRDGENALADTLRLSPHRLLWPLALLVGLGLWIPPGPLHSAAGSLLVGGGVLVGIVVGHRLGALLMLAAFAGFELAFRDASGHTELALPLDLLRRVVQLFVAPLLVHACLPEAGGSPRHVSPAHLYLPLSAAIPVSIVAVVRAHASPPAEALPGLDIVRAILAAYYALVFTIVVTERWRRPAPVRSGAEVAADLERSGRFAVAGRVHARQGHAALGAEAAQRGGDLPLAARLYREAGDTLKAGDMYYRSGQLEEAAAQYSRAGAHAAAARVYEQLGRPQEAAAAWERAGDLPAAVRALQGAGVQPDAELLRRAGLIREAVASWEAAGSFTRAAEALEHEVGDLAAAAAAYLRAGEARRAAPLLEQLGRIDEAIDAFARAPEGRLDALRLSVDSGNFERAEALLGTLPSELTASLQDEQALVMLARLHEHAGRTKAAIALLQKARRLDGCSGTTRLTLGRLLLGAGLEELAEQELRVAAEMPLDPVQQMESAYLLACVLEKRGLKQEARAIFADLAQKDLGYRDVEERYRRLSASA